MPDKGQRGATGSVPEQDNLWEFSGRSFDLGKRALVMGILNVTPDSFSDGGEHNEPSAARDAALQMIAEGADIIDIGGESTRPGADPVPAEEELRRVLPAIRAIRAACGDLPISIDTAKAEVAAAALGAGADIINDVTGLTGDPAMAEVAARTDAGVVAMHMLGEPRTMQTDPRYTDVVAEVGEYLAARVDALAASGIHPRRVLVDPGFGFGKTVAHNLELLRGLPRLRARGRPVLVGLSRKSTLGTLLGDRPPAGLTWATVATTALARELGAGVVRVHDVQANADALRMTEAILSAA